jgi:hypothetical protein
MSRPFFFATLILLTGLAHPAAAQSTATSSQTTVQDIVTFLVTNQGVATSDFDKDRAAADATSQMSSAHSPQAPARPRSASTSSIRNSRRSTATTSETERWSPLPTSSVTKPRRSIPKR